MVPSPEKERLDSSLSARVRETQNPWTVDGLMDKFQDLNHYDLLSKESELNKKQNFERFLKNLSSEPLFPTMYKQLGISPRIQPTKSSCTVNSAKKFLRNLFVPRDG